MNFKWGSIKHGVYRHTLTEYNYPLQHALWVVTDGGWGTPGAIEMGAFLHNAIDQHGEDYEIL
jgi:hypothetical protein